MGNLYVVGDRTNCTMGAATGGVNKCGDGSKSECGSPAVPGGCFKPSYEGAANPAKVSNFRFGKWEFTVGRFRVFVDAWLAGWRTFRVHGALPASSNAFMTSVSAAQDQTFPHALGMAMCFLVRQAFAPPEWAGADCSLCASGCVGPDCKTSDTTTCHGHGAAQTTGTYLRAAGYTGAECSQCANSFTAVDGDRGSPVCTVIPKDGVTPIQCAVGFTDSTGPADGGTRVPVPIDGIRSIPCDTGFTDSKGVACQGR